MDLDSDAENNITELQINSIKSDAYVENKTFESDTNENKGPCFQDLNVFESAPSSIEEYYDDSGNASIQPSEFGDSNVPEESYSDSLESTREVDDHVITNTENLKSSLINENDTEPIAQDANINEALKYFSRVDEDVTDVDSSYEVLCEENPFEDEIPNGIVNNTEKELNTHHSIKQVPLDKKKCKNILFALQNNDTNTLKLAAISEGGLITDEIRKKVWPKLVGVDIYETSPRPSQTEIEAHPYYGQVVLDVNRSLKRFPPSIHEAQRLMMLDQLVFLIMRVLCRHPEMHYYQGYHDICVTFLLVLGEEMAYHVVEKLSTTHLKTFMEKNMEPTIHQLEHMYVLIGKKRPILKEFLLKSEVGVAYCLSWLITWFGHVLNDYNYVVRLFDFFIVSHPYMPLYLTTAVVLHQESGVLKQDCEMASVHSFLSKISDDLPFEELILESLSLFKDYSPEMLNIEHPYVPRSLKKPNKKLNLFQTISKTIKRVVPASNIAIPFVVAAAVVVTAVIYQTYKY